MNKMAKGVYFLVVLLILSVLLISSLLSVSPVLAAKGERTVSVKNTAPVSRAADSTSDKQDKAIERYIVILADQSLALYKGDIKGLKATNPKAAGMSRLDLAGAACQAYLGHLEGKQNAALSAIGQALGESPLVFRRYQVVLNGFCLKMNPAQARKISGLSGVKSVVPDVRCKDRCRSPVDRRRGPLERGQRPRLDQG